MSDPTQGSRVGDYQLIELVGQGSMGAVWRARDLDDDREVALKVMGSHLLDDEGALRRFERELASLIELRHPAIVAVHDAGRLPDGRPWYAMDYVPGETLRDALRRGVELEQALAVLEQMVEALAHLHRNGLVHRDFKPDNVLLEPDGRARLSDFGLARPAERADERLTRTSEILGTPTYMAPEQVSTRLGEIAAHTDVWSFGAVLYELLTGRTPYEGKTALECFTQLSERAPIPSPAALGCAVDPRLEALCMKALEHDPARRHADAEELARALAEARQGAGSPLLLRALVVLAVTSVLLGAIALGSTLSDPDDPAPVVLAERKREPPPPAIAVPVAPLAPAAPLASQARKSGPLLVWGRWSGEPALAQVDWGAGAQATRKLRAAVPSLLDAFGASERDERRAELQAANEPLVTIEGLLQGKLPTHAPLNGACTHPVVQVNLMAEHLALAGLPLSEEQREATVRAGEGFELSWEEQQSTRQPGASALEKLLGELRLKRELSAVLDGILEPAQRESLCSPAARHLSRLDAFSPVLILTQVTHRPVGDEDQAARLLSWFASTQWELTEEQLGLELLQTWAAAALAPQPREPSSRWLFHVDDALLAGEAQLLAMRALLAREDLPEATRATLLSSQHLALPRRGR